MKTVRTGFSLIELMIYIMLIAITSLLVGICLHRFLQASMDLSKTTSDYVQLSIIATQFSYDAHRAPADMRRWDIQEQAVSWQGKQQGAQKYVWKLQGERIMRTQGEETAAVADGIDQFKGEIIPAGQWVGAVVLTLRKGKAALRRSIVPYERMFACTS